MILAKTTEGLVGKLQALKYTLVTTHNSLKGEALGEFIYERTDLPTFLKFEDTDEGRKTRSRIEYRVMAFYEKHVSFLEEMGEDLSTENIMEKADEYIGHDFADYFGQIATTPPEKIEKELAELPGYCGLKLEQSHGPIQAKDNKVLIIRGRLSKRMVSMHGLIMTEQQDLMTLDDETLERMADAARNGNHILGFLHKVGNPDSIPYNIKNRPNTEGLCGHPLILGVRTPIDQQDIYSVSTKIIPSDAPPVQ